ncbi:hypothetical protein CEXT_255761 [Caerostris extrusa]|uniref:Uncharacterized protein n=1 Tax=Caerostris extrusa TaxID=172846 RepID=A0AAV4WMT2_CAEEX|nr:hypothetical protein CEXT_255761 [Caerostris extrusa]
MHLNIFENKFVKNEDNVSRAFFASVFIFFTYAYATQFYELYHHYFGAGSFLWNSHKLEQIFSKILLRALVPKVGHTNPTPRGQWNIQVFGLLTFPCISLMNPLCRKSTTSVDQHCSQFGPNPPPPGFPTVVKGLPPKRVNAIIFGRGKSLLSVFS